MWVAGILFFLISLTSLFGVSRGFVADLSLLAFAGTPVGQVVNFNGRKFFNNHLRKLRHAPALLANSAVDIYVSKPKDLQSQQNDNGIGAAPKPIYGVLHLTDVFGIQSTENKLLSDSFARAGYLTVTPDLFNGKPRSEDPKSSFNATEFFGFHGPSVTDPIVSTTISYMREQLGVSKIAATGYCFGGRYAFRALGLPNGKAVNVAFAAHPTLLGDNEIKARKGPASLAVAENDTGMLVKRRVEIEAAMGSSGQPFTMALYGGAPHGFATHPNLDIPVEKAGKEDAFLQAVRYFETWL